MEVFEVSSENTLDPNCNIFGCLDPNHRKLRGSRVRKFVLVQVIQKSGVCGNSVVLIQLLEDFRSDTRYSSQTIIEREDTLRASQESRPTESLWHWAEKVGGGSCKPIIQSAFPKKVCTKSYAHRSAISSSTRIDLEAFSAFRRETERLRTLESSK